VIERVGFSHVTREVARWADLLRERGVQPGERVVVLAGRDREWRSALLGVLQAGGVAVPCPGSTPVADLRAMAADANAVLFVSAEARPDLAAGDGARVLSADDLRTRDATQPAQAPHDTMPDDVALILYARGAAGLHGVTYTHTALLGRAEAGKHWLGVRQDERVWCTAADGSDESIWLLLAAWREGAEILALDLPVDLQEQLELLDKLHPSAVWFSDDEYAVLASAPVPAWFRLDSIRRALASGERMDGATAFQNAFGADVVAVLGSTEIGPVAPEQVEPEAVQLATVDEPH
jgi:acyl-coenzyme A synthetase/AMP-(fatty) acid ligase